MGKEEPKEESTKDKQNPLPDETDKLNEIPVEEIVPEEKDNVPPKTNISENKVQPTVEPSPPINRSAEIPVVEPEEEVEEEKPKEEPKEDVKIPEEPEEIPEEEPKEDIDSSAIKEEPKEDIVPDTKEDIVVPEKTDNIATEQVENKEEP